MIVGLYCSGPRGSKRMDVVWRRRLAHLSSLTRFVPPQYPFCSLEATPCNISLAISTKPPAKPLKYRQRYVLNSSYFESPLIHYTQINTPFPHFLQSSNGISLPIELIRSHFLSTGKIDTGSARACAKDAFGVVGGTKERIQTTR